MMRMSLVPWRLTLPFSISFREYINQVLILDEEDRDCAAAMFSCSNAKECMAVLIAFHHRDLYYHELQNLQQIALQQENSSLT